MKMSKSYELAKKCLGTVVDVVIDRPLGSKHPKHGFEYPINYGYIENVIAPDNEELDAYVLGVGESVESFTGTVIAIVHRNDDDDDKLVVAREGDREWSDEDIMNEVSFQEKWFDSVIVRR